MFDRMTKKVASKVLGETSAAAAPCEGPLSYQYRCVRGPLGNMIKQRRQCYTDRCDRRTYCSGWVEIACC